MNLQDRANIIFNALKQTDIYEALREYHHSENYEGRFSVYAVTEVERLFLALGKQEQELSRSTQREGTKR